MLKDSLGTTKRIRHCKVMCDKDATCHAAEYHKTSGKCFKWLHDPTSEYAGTGNPQAACMVKKGSP